MGTGELSGKWQPDEMLKGNLAEDWLLIWGGGEGGGEAMQSKLLHVMETGISFNHTVDEVTWLDC